MKKWIKRYLIITICLLLVILPLIAIIGYYDVLSTQNRKIIFYSVLGVLIIVYYVVMSYFMLKNRK